MSEPRSVAQSVESLDEDLGISYWTVADDRIGGHISTAYALHTDEGTVLIDPLPLAPDALASLGEIVAIVLTSGSHQRSAWRLRSELEVPVWAPALAHELDEEPDDRYGHGAVLPGELVAFFTPGPGTTQHTLILDDFVGFVPDLVLNPPGGELQLTPDELMQDPRKARESVRLLLEESIDILCPSHGVPIADDVHGLLQAALDEAGELDDPDYVEVPPEDGEEPEAGEKPERED